MMNFGNQVLIWFPIIRIKARNRHGREFPKQVPATFIGSSTKRKSQHLSVLRRICQPQPTLILFLLDIRPHFIKFDIRHLCGKFNCRQRFGFPTNDSHHGGRGNSQNPRRISNARTVQTHRHNQFSNLFQICSISISENELFAAIVASIALFCLLVCAILLDVQAWTSRTSYWFKLHTWILACPNLKHLFCYTTKVTMRGRNAPVSTVVFAAKTAAETNRVMTPTALSAWIRTPARIFAIAAAKKVC